MWIVMIGREAHTLNPYPKTLTPLIQPYSHGISLSSSIADGQHVYREMMIDDVYWHWNFSDPARIREIQNAVRPDIDADYNAGVGGIKVFAWRVSFDWCTPRRDQPNSIPDAQHVWIFSNDALLVYICNLNRAYSTLNRAPWSTESTYSTIFSPGLRQGNQR